MTRTGKSPRLSSHILETYVEVHPADASRFGLNDGGLARLESRWGRMIARVVVTDAQQLGSVFVPMHWNSQFSSHGRVGPLVNAAVDPISGQPESKHTPVRISSYKPGWYGFLLSRKTLTPPTNYWVKAIGNGYWHYELADEHVPANWSDWARESFGEQGEWLDYVDAGLGRYRGANIVDGRLQACVFVSPSVDLPSRNWLASLFRTELLSDSDRIGLLAGKPVRGQADTGATVCACFNVGVNTIVDAIVKQGLNTPEAIGQALKAGTNCGSCIPELKALIATRGKKHVA